MTTISMSAQAAAPASKSVNSTVTSNKDAQFLGRLTGLMFLITYATSIPPFISLYVPALKDPAFILGGALDVNVSWGAILELLLILANVATAVALYPVLKKRFPVLSLSFVGARIIESAFIAIGIVAIMALNTLRMQGAVDEGSLTVAGQALVAIHDWTFNLGPGVVVGVGNGLILGYMMWKTRLVPRVMSFLGLIGGPALLLAGGAVVLGHIQAGSPTQMLFTMPEFFWELSLGIWLLVRGFSPKALAELDAQQA
jgi:Domain of unknown function (DUF4386)